MPLGLKRGQFSLPYIDPVRGHNWTNVKSVHKFGNNPDCDAAVDVWDGDLTYTYDASAVTMYISSDASGDTSIEFTVEGLDANWDIQTEVISTDASDGTTFVALANTYIRIYRAYVSGATAPSGDVYISMDNTDSGGDGIPDTLANMRAKVLIGNNQTLMSIYTIPNNFTGYLMGHASSVLGGGTASVDMSLQTRINGGVFRVKDSWGIKADGGTPFVKEMLLPTGLPEKTDIKMRVTSVSTTNLSVSATFFILLVGDG